MDTYSVSHAQVNADGQSELILGVYAYQLFYWQWSLLIVTVDVYATAE